MKKSIFNLILYFLYLINCKKKKKSEWKRKKNYSIDM